MGESVPALTWVTAAERVDQDIRDQLRTCWRDVANAGGAVGFPFLPADDDQVGREVDRMVEALGAEDRLLPATTGGTLAGWLLLRANRTPLTSHWAKVLRVQTGLQHRGRGVGGALMREVARAAYEDLGLEQLHLELRGGQGLEAFYDRLGWEVVGRWPRALRLAEDDSRDEVLMLLALPASANR